MSADGLHGRRVHFGGGSWLPAPATVESTAFGFGCLYISGLRACCLAALRFLSRPRSTRDAQRVPANGAAQVAAAGERQVVVRSLY